MTNFASLFTLARTVIKPIVDVLTNSEITVLNDVQFAMEAPGLKECYPSLFTDVPHLQLFVCEDVYEPEVNKMEIHIRVYDADRFNAEDILYIPYTAEYTSDGLLLVILERLCAMLDKKMKGDNS